MAQTAIIYHPDYELHDTGSSHPETKSRAKIIYDFIKKSDIEHERVLSTVSRRILQHQFRVE